MYGGSSARYGRRRSQLDRRCRVPEDSTWSLQCQVSAIGSAFDLELSVINCDVVYFEGVSGGVRWSVEGFACLEVELGSVPWTPEDSVADAAVGERAAGVRAEVVYGV